MNGDLGDQTSDDAPEATQPIRVFDGWALHAVLRMGDEAGDAGGLLRFLLSASDLRRQVVFATLASGVTYDAVDFLYRIGDGHDWATPAAGVVDALKHARLGALLNVAWPRATSAGAARPKLGRLGPSPLPKDGYHRLFRVAADPERGHVLAYVDLDAGRLDALEALDPTLLHPTVLARLKCREDAELLNASAMLIRRHVSDVTDLTLRESLVSASSTRKWSRHWLSRMDRFSSAPPVSGDHEVVPLRTCAALAEAARRYRNCLGGTQRRAEAASGVCVYYEALKPQVIIELRRMMGPDGFAVAGMWGLGNSYVPKETRNELRDRFAGWGIPTWRHATVPLEWAAMLGWSNELDDVED